MKNIFILFALTIIATNVFANESPVIKQKQETKKKTPINLPVIFQKKTNKLVACTRYGTATVGGTCVDITVTAATCDEAQKGVDDARKQMEQ